MNSRTGAVLGIAAAKHGNAPDFKTRHYFIISRGLESLEYYAAALADSFLVNLQISVDILPDGRIIPDKERLAFFAQQPKAIFRFKTTTANAQRFLDLARELGIDFARIMETPLRKFGEPHAYSQSTPLEKIGLGWQRFGRCNTACELCHKENGFLLCAAKPESLTRLATLQRQPPPRFDEIKPEKINWHNEMSRCFTEHGDTITNQEAYSWFLKRFPILALQKLSWQAKVREAIQKQAHSTGTRGQWTRKRKQTLSSFFLG